MANDKLKFTVSAEDRASRVFSRIGRSAGAMSQHVGRAGKVATKGLALGAKAGLGMAAGVAGVGVAAAVGAGAIAKFGLGVAADMETAKISFTTMLGSAKKADVFLRQLSDFAASTPFEFPELQQAASSLISAGISAKKVIPIMTTLGDVTSGMGTGSEGVQRATIAIQQMTAAGRVQAEDLNQLRDAGIPVYDLLASATGKSKKEVVKLVQAGKLGADVLGKMMKALETGKGLERFRGLMKAQSASLTGLWSTLKDTFGMGLARALKPSIPLIKDAMGGAFKVLSSAMGSLGRGAKRFAGFWTRSLFPALKKMAHEILPAVSLGFSILTQGQGKNALSWKQVGTFIVTKAIPAFTKFAQIAIPLVAGALRFVWVSLKTTAKVVGFLVRAFRAGFGGITRVVLSTVHVMLLAMAKAFGWIPGLGPKLRRAAGEFGKFRSRVTALINGIKPLTLRVRTNGDRAAASRLANLRAQVQSIPREVTIRVTNKISANPSKFRATGGQVLRGHSYIVGERRPEMFVPSQSGRIVPRPDGGGGGGSAESIQVNLHLDGKQIQQSLVRLRRQRGKALGIA